MRKGLIFKKGIAIALTAAMVISLAPTLGTSGWGVMNAKAEETTTGTIPQSLYIMGEDWSQSNIISNGELQDDGVSGSFLSLNGDLSVILSGTNTMNSSGMIQSVLTKGGFATTLEINVV